MAVSWREEREIGDDEIGLISQAIAAQCAEVIERIQMALLNLESAKQIEQMVESIQRSLLTSSPTSPLLDITTHYLPAARATQVGGDWYDAFTTKAGSTLLVVGDVAGHDGDSRPPPWRSCATSYAAWPSVGTTDHPSSSINSMNRLWP